MSQRFELDDAYPNLWQKMQDAFAQLDASTLAQFVLNVQKWAGVHNSEAILAVATAIYESLHRVDDEEAFHRELRRLSFAATLGGRAEVRRQERANEFQNQAAIDAASARAVEDALEDIEEEDEEAAASET